MIIVLRILVKCYLFKVLGTKQKCINEMYISIKCHLLPHNLPMRSSLSGGQMSMKLLKGKEKEEPQEPKY